MFGGCPASSLMELHFSRDYIGDVCLCPSIFLTGVPGGVVSFFLITVVQQIANISLPLLREAPFCLFDKHIVCL